MDTIKNIRRTIQTEIEVIFSEISKKSEENYFLLLANAEDTTNDKRLPYGTVLESSLDLTVDRTRLDYCSQFMDSVYKTDNVDYSGEYGLFRLNTELLIYMQTWESIPFLKLLYRLAHARISYDWQVTVPVTGKYIFLLNNICKLFDEQGFELGKIIRQSYSSHLRNSVAHSLYCIVESTREIMLYDDQSIKEKDARVIPVESFQNKFLQSVCLTIMLHNYWEKLRCDYAKELNGKPVKIHLPNGNEVFSTAKWLDGGRPCFYQCR
ncbi:MAG: hypothetical protein K6E96_08980 [Bacteroidales bacterium]|nr:hypothetical protein [Bacteroidales bacterium]